MKFYRAAGPIRAISFDLDDTLYDNHDVIMRMEQALNDWLTSQHPTTVGVDWRAQRQAVLSAAPSLRHDVSQLRYQQLLSGFLACGYAAHQAHESAKQGMAVVHDWRNRVEVPTETHQVMTQLAKHIPLVAITNGNVDVTEIGLSVYFTHTFKAGVDGPAKPAAAMFEQACQRLAIAPSELLHVGDHVLTDVNGANRYGAMSCWYNPNRLSLRDTKHALSLPTCEIQQLSDLLMFLA